MSRLATPGSGPIWRGREASASGQEAATPSHPQSRTISRPPCARSLLHFCWSTACERFGDFSCVRRARFGRALCHESAHGTLVGPVAGVVRRRSRDRRRDMAPASLDLRASGHESNAIGRPLGGRFEPSAMRSSGRPLAAGSGASASAGCALVAICETQLIRGMGPAPVPAPVPLGAAACKLELFGSGQSRSDLASSIYRLTTCRQTTYSHADGIATAELFRACVFDRRAFARVRDHAPSRASYRTAACGSQPARCTHCSNGRSGRSS